MTLTQYEKKQFQQEKEVILLEEKIKDEIEELKKTYKTLFILEGIEALPVSWVKMEKEIIETVVEIGANDFDFLDLESIMSELQYLVMEEY